MPKEPLPTARILVYAPTTFEGTIVTDVCARPCVTTFDFLGVPDCAQKSSLLGWNTPWRVGSYRPVNVGMEHSFLY